MSLYDNLEDFFIQALTAYQQYCPVMERLQKISTTMELQRKMDEMFLVEYHRYFLKKYPHGTKDGVSAEMLAAYHCHGNTNTILLWHQKGFPISIEQLAAHLADVLSRA